VRGVVAFWMGDGARGRALLESALAAFRRLGNRMQVGFVLYNLGFVAHGLGDYPAARACYEERLAMAGEVGFRMGIGEALGGLGDLALDRGDLDGARSHLDEALPIHRDLGNRREIAHVLECFAGLAALRDQRERAVRLWSAATALRQVIDEPIPPDQGIRLGRRLGRLREVAGEEAFARMWAEGQAMTLGEAIAVALLGGEHPHEDGSRRARR
jgi:tetratricopeptide (TPR) repeat protein